MKSLVIAPHPDDELLGLGGTLLKKKDQGNVIGWLIMTTMDEKNGWNKDQIDTRSQEINSVRIGLGINNTKLYQLNFPTTKLDQIPISKIISKVKYVFNEFEPDEIFIPHFGDIHTDHKITFEIAASCSKWFRNKSIKRIYSYETISETEYNIKPNNNFNPNYFIDITQYMEEKLRLVNIYKSEIQKCPFPRSNEVIMALATYRGSQAGCRYAESLNLVKGIE